MTSVTGNPRHGTFVAVKAFLARMFLSRIIRAPDIKIEAILPIVRRYPYWLSGHLFVAEYALANKDVGRAYAAAQAVLAASFRTSSSYRKKAEFILARCHLSKGDASSALALFEDWKLKYSTTAKAQEEIAACLMALSRLQEAHTTLSSINPNRLSQEGRAALLFLTTKLEAVKGNQ